MDSFRAVGDALRCTSKGKLSYDRHWVEEGRTKEILDSISEYSTKVAICISPKILSAINSQLQDKNEKKEWEETVCTKAFDTKWSEPDDNTDTYFYKLQSEMKLPVLEYEEERMKYLQDVFKTKQWEYENCTHDLQQQLEQAYQLLKRKNELDAKRRSGDLQKIEESVLQEAMEGALLQKEQYHSQAKKLSTKVLEAEMKQKKAKDDLQKKMQEQQELRAQLNNCQMEAQNLLAKSLEKLNTCEHSSYLRVSVSDHMNQIKNILNDINSFVDERKAQELTIDDILHANFIVKKTCELLQDVANDIELAKKTHASKSVHKETIISHNTAGGIVSKSSKPAVDANRTSENATVIQEKMDVQLIEEVNVAAEKKANEGTKKLISVFIAPDAFHDYYEIMENFKQVQAVAKKIVDDSRNNKYRLELSKSINVPINAVCSNSGSHIRDNRNRLLSVLSAKAQQVYGCEMNAEMAVYNFCVNLIAKQFVEQGYRQIAAKHSTAFPIAMTVVGVWMKKTDVGKLILGHFYTNCPYLVPYYPPRKEGDSDEDYYKSLGYLFDREGNREQNFKFLNRMSGYMRLYAAIIQSPIPQNSKSPHPHGISWGWRWLTRILNLDPRPDITATLLLDFLDVTGYTLQKIYGKQFKKILHILCKDYFQKIKRATPGGSGGPIERLETFLQETVKKGHISLPKGSLDASFWHS